MKNTTLQESDGLLTTDTNDNPHALNDLKDN